MKRLISLLTAILMIITVIPFSHASGEYVITDIGDNRGRLDKAEIRDGVALCDPDETELVIVELGAELCSYSNITSIDFPERLERIGYCAFIGCDKLESLEIPLTVKIIETYAFSECYSLKSVTIPETVEYIGEWAFDFGDTEVKVYKDSYAEKYCIDNGYEYILADKGCGHGETEEVITEYETCVYPGERAKRCVSCKKLTEREEVEASGHRYSNWSIENGVRSRRCNICKNSFENFDRSYSDLSFTDIKKGSWYYESVEFCFTNGLVKGTSNTSFAPAANTTRAMVVQILSQYAGADLSVYTESGFNDVKISSWYGPAVAWAGENGIVNGNGKGGFMPDDNVTREQLTVIIKNFADFMGYPYFENTTDISGTFTDGSKTASWAKDAMGWAVSLGIISGVGGAKLDPKGLAARNQIVKIIKYFADIFEPEALYGYDRVVVFMIDGAGNYIKDASTPNIDSIFELQTVSGATSPVDCVSERASILTGANANTHNWSMDAAARNIYNGRDAVKSFLGEVKEAYPEKEVACFASSLEISRIIEEEGGIYAPVDESSVDDVITDMLIKEDGYLENNDPALLLVEMRQVLQGAIHFEGGYGGNDYMTQISLTDGYIGRIYDKYEELGRNENTLYLLISDHGGIRGTSQTSGDSDDVLNTFFAAGGKSVNENAALEGFVNTDIYGIITDIFGIDRPYTSLSKKYNDLFIGE